jgi:hypothetical protein
VNQFLNELAGWTILAGMCFSLLVFAFGLGRLVLYLVVDSLAVWANAWFGQPCGSHRKPLILVKK